MIFQAMFSFPQVFCLRTGLAMSRIVPSTNPQHVFNFSYELIMHMLPTFLELTVFHQNPKKISIAAHWLFLISFPLAIQIFIAWSASRLGYASLFRSIHNPITGSSVVRFPPRIGTGICRTSTSCSTSGLVNWK